MVMKMKSDEEKFEEMKETLRYIDKSMQDMRETIDTLEKENEELKQDKDTLMKIAMKTHDSMIFPEIAHKVNFALIEVLKDSSSDEDKLSRLKTYLKPSLDNDVHEVLNYIEEFKKDNERHETLLNDLSSWIKYTYRLN